MQLNESRNRGKKWEYNPSVPRVYFVFYGFFFKKKLLSSDLLLSSPAVSIRLAEPVFRTLRVWLIL